MDISKKRDVVVVAMKLKPDSSELLTWTLAKFTKPGDHVVVLHVATRDRFSFSLSASEITSTLQEEIEGTFDSVLGVYDAFCRIKQIQLQLKVVRNRLSIRRTLVEEVKQQDAVRLILGAPEMQKWSEKSSSTLAKYCCTHLPMTCSILVIHYGQVVFKRNGVLALEVDSDFEGTLSKSQKDARKSAGRTVRQNSRKQYTVCNQKKAQKNEHMLSESSIALNASQSVFHPYKYVPPLLQDLESCTSDYETLNPMAGTSSQKSESHVHNLDCKDRNPSVNDNSYPKNVHSGMNDQNSTDNPPVVKNPNQRCRDTYQHSGQRNCNSHIALRGSKHQITNIPQGWPFLHQSIGASKLENPHLIARQMSVVEWVLQLPERPVGVRKQSPDPLKQEISVCSVKEKEQTPISISTQHSKQYEALSNMEDKDEITFFEMCALLCKKRDCVLYQHADLEKSTDHFSKDNMIGKGGCSQVYRGVLPNARIVAIKCFDIAAASTAQNEFLTELEIVSTLDHQNIIELLGYCVENQQKPIIVYDFAAEGSLEQKLHEDMKSTLPWNVRYKVAVGIGEALEYIHNSSPPLIHRDVKSSNILLQSDFTPQLTDFGLSKWMSVDSTFVTCNDVVGTFGYLAPEYFMFGKVSDKTDVYSFGVVLLELVSGRHPITNNGPSCHGNLVSWARPHLENESSYDQIVDHRLGREFDAAELRYMLRAASLCLQQSPQARPTIKNIMKLLRGETVTFEPKQDSMMSIDGNLTDGDCIQSFGSYDIHNHLMLALNILDEDLPLQGSSINQKSHCNDPNKLIEEYLQGRYSHPGNGS
ncbi:hypothetical protein KP509_15G055100 [Ceratopteris richardii]|uniref:Protein kinase domain-containing protein n=2 Tax=Ceratopteris richardii TaxID=49495 RepID=A0A8T2T5A7_CERRI|nr:hypothetical protein KP509_15G055100 [Ceratopteris richardii]KAH7405057.1 hypothetical protein KP509_15G055100 [Ceratopteris richardii]